MYTIPSQQRAPSNVWIHIFIMEVSQLHLLQKVPSLHGRSVCNLQSPEYFLYLLPHLRIIAIWPCLLQNATLSWAFMITVERQENTTHPQGGVTFHIYSQYNMAWFASTNTYTRIMAIHTLIITLSNRIALYNMSAAQTLDIHTCEHRLAQQR